MKEIRDIKAFLHKIYDVLFYIFLLISVLVMLAIINTAKGADTISVKFERKNLPLVQVQLNGQTAFFLFDSGAESTLFNRKDAKFFGVQYYATDDQIEGVGGQQETYRANSVVFQIGTATCKTDMKIMDLKYLCDNVTAKTGRPVSGILGNDMMIKYKLVLDYSTYTIHN